MNKIKVIEDIETQLIPSGELLIVKCKDGQELHGVFVKMQDVIQLKNENKYRFIHMRSMPYFQASNDIIYTFPVDLDNVESIVPYLLTKTIHINNVIPQKHLLKFSSKGNKLNFHVDRIQVEMFYNKSTVSQQSFITKNFLAEALHADKLNKLFKFSLPPNISDISIVCKSVWKDVNGIQQGAHLDLTPLEISIE
jgi:hypothetical protein